MIVLLAETVEQLEGAHNACCWPPNGTSGVGYSRENLFGKKFHYYLELAQGYLLIVQIGHIRVARNLADLLRVKGMDGNIERIMTCQYKRL